MKWAKWAPGYGPNYTVGEETCASIRPDGELDTMDCTWEFCTLCQLEKESVLHLRGSCPEQGLDLVYTMKLGERRDGRYEIWGWRKTKLTWSETKWSFVNMLTKKEVAFTNSTNLVEILSFNIKETSATYMSLLFISIIGQTMHGIPCILRS